MSIYEKKEQCCGCSACANVCPKQCIKMNEDEEGFLYPTVDYDQCINCGLCEKVCSFKKKDEKNSVLEAYGCNAISDDIRKRSSSGGVFSLLAEYIISQGGVVFGTAMTDDCKSAFLLKIQTEDEIGRLSGSKYFQSEVGSSFQQAKRELEQGRIVLFTGTPCQINGLKLFLNKDYENLFCMDIICHGVPSPKLWKKYITDFEEKHKGKVTGVNFRCKDVSGNDFGMKEFLNQSAIFTPKSEDPFMQMFLKNYCLRTSCYACDAKQYKLADITIGDFWGVENVLPDLSDDKGTSLVLIRTEKGAELFKAIKSSVKYDLCEYEAAVKRNSAEYKSVAKPPQREGFFADMNNMSLKKLKGKYLESPLKKKTKKALAKIFRGGDNCHILKNSNYGLLVQYHSEGNRK